MKKLKNKPIPIQLALSLQKATVHRDDLPVRTAFTRWVKAALQAADPALLQDDQPIELTIRLADTEESARLNKQYRDKTGPTNILSFPCEASVFDIEDQAYYLGDLLFCVPLVLQEAALQKKSSMAHFAHLTVHGVLHLLGYDHIKSKEAIEMESLEIAVLKQLGIENPYI